MGCTTYPEIPSVPQIPPRVAYHDHFGWSAGANSVVTVDGDAICQFTMRHAVGAVIGFTTSLGDVTDHARCSHAFYFALTEGGDPCYRIVESGVVVRPASSYVPETTTFVVRRIGSRVDYLVDGFLVLTSRVPSVGTLSVGASLYATGDEAP